MTSAIARPSTLAADRPWPPQIVATGTDVGGAVEVCGRLVHDAELRLQSDGARGVLHIEISTGRGFAYAATFAVSGEPHVLQEAATLARQLRRGTSARVRALGCLPRTDHGHALLNLLDVIAVTPIKEET